MQFERGTEEFSRYCNFTDAVFAIAMTIIVVGIEVPDVHPEHLRAALEDLRAPIVSFFISFAVLGFYWLAHHRFTRTLARIDTGFLVIGLFYLSMIAFIPFPTALVGRYESNEITVIIYAITLGAASLSETVLYRRAYRQDLFFERPAPEAYRYGLTASFIPAVVFMVSIPIAFAFGSTIALWSWLFLNYPIQFLLGRRERRRGVTAPDA